jgi:dienelactone hydrolase
MIRSILFLVLPLVVVATAAAGDAQQTRDQFLELVRPQKTELQPEVIALGESGDLVREKVFFQSEPGQRVAMLVVRAKGGAARRPAVLVLHGTRGRKEGMESWLNELANRGFVACATDARWHGELARGDYEDAIIQSYRTGKGHPWLYETVTDTIRAIDYLQTRPDVDGARIGMIGISMGGMNTWLTAAADPRVKVAIPCIGVTSFGYQVEHAQHQARCATLPRFHQVVAEALGESQITPRVAKEAWDKVLPGITGRFDCPAMLTAIAPRPLLILNGEKDERCPLEGVRKCYAAAETAYQSANAADHLKLNVAPNTGHQVTDAQKALALDWFVRWLKP